MNAEKEKGEEMKQVQAAAIVTIRNADRMTKNGRKRVAVWLRKTADDLVKYGNDYSPRYTARYWYKQDVDAPEF